MDLNWRRNERLRITKQLAAQILIFKHVDKARLFNEEVPRFLPLILQDLLGVSMSFEELCAETLQQQGVELTPDRLWSAGERTKCQLMSLAFEYAREHGIEVTTENLRQITVWAVNEWRLEAEEEEARGAPD